MLRAWAHIRPAREFLGGAAGGITFFDKEKYADIDHGRCVFQLTVAETMTFLF